MNIYYRFLFFISGILFSVIITPASGQNFKVQDVLVSAEDACIGDIEMDPLQNRICWQSPLNHDLWVCRLDTTTWALTEPYGMETFIDSSLAALENTRNGGEWGCDMNGTILVYTKSINRVRYIAVAAETSSGWILTTLFDAPHRMNPHVTQNPADSFAAMHYRRNPFSPNTKYKFLNDPFTEYGLSWVTDAHWALNEQVLLGIYYNDQVVMFDPHDPMLPVQLTDDLTKNYSLPNMWRAPEHLNARMFFARADNEEIQVYKEKVRESNHFELYMQFSSPSANPLYNKISSPEPVVYEGQSYITLMVSSSPYENANVPGEIWIVKVDSLNPIFRQISDTAVSIRTDPEPFPTSERLLVYYTEVLYPSISEPIYRIRKCETGFLATPPTAIPEGYAEGNGNLVYPNPFKNKLSLQAATGKEKFQIKTSQGQLIWSGNYLEGADFSFLPKSAYFLSITRSNLVETVKVVKE